MVNLLVGDVIQVLQERVPDGCVQTCITSPPYYSARTYNVDGQLGHEETPDAYIKKMVEVFREVKRVLRDDGIAWININDSYSTCVGSYGRNDAGKTGQSTGGKYKTKRSGKDYYEKGTFKADAGMPNKNLLGIPFRLAMAMQADGWIWRQTIIWYQPGTMPDPAKDRPGCTHEYILMMAKSQHYYYDLHAATEISKFSSMVEQGNRYHRSVWTLSAGSAGLELCGGCLRTYHSDEYRRLAKNKDGMKICESCGSESWEAHAAPYPEKLIVPCVLTSTSEKVCNECGTGWVRFKDDWKQNCKCESKTRPALILDPFNGSGTTGIVSMRLGRNYVGIDLNVKYVGMAWERMRRLAASRGMNIE